MQTRLSIDELIRAAEAATRAGQRAESVQILERVLALAPQEPRALNTLGNWALEQGDARRSRELLTRAAAAAPEAPAIQFNLALACRAAGDLPSALRHFDLALAADPYFVQAMFQKGLAMEALGMFREAALTYKDMLDCAPDSVRASPAFRDVIEHATAVVKRNDVSLEQTINTRLAQSTGAARAPRSKRVDECVGALVGKHKAYVQQPTLLHVPRLPAIPFFERSPTPWIATLEEATADIRAELQSLLGATGSSFVPYIQIPAGEPQNQWAALDRSPDWSAYFFWRHGQRVAANCERCPRTAAILDALPIARIPRRAPNAFFSVLRPNARIPPHTGVTNMRSVAHLGLIVPERCGFRVGAEVRQWTEGEAWVFDDTIEHEAWNESGELRAVLIFDIWNPLLEEDERSDLCGVIEAIDAHYGRVIEWQDKP